MEGGNPYDTRINISVPTTSMVTFCEEPIYRFNEQQMRSADPSVRKAFQKGGQDRWFPCDDMFDLHIPSLQKDALYRHSIESNTVDNFDKEKVLVLCLHIFICIHLTCFQINL